MANTKSMTRKQAKRKGLLGPSHRVYFDAHTRVVGGRTITSKIKPGALVKQPRSLVPIVVKQKHAQASLDENGCGNAQLCTLAQAIWDNRHSFPHPVTGTVQVNRSTIFVVDKEKVVNGVSIPASAYRYYCHTPDRRNIDVTNDQKLGGLHRLIKQLGEGDVELTFYPRNRDNEKWTREGGQGRTDGTRTSGRRAGPQRRFIEATHGVGGTATQAE